MNIVLVSHGSLCEGVSDAYHMLFASATNVHTVSLTDVGVESFRASLREKLTELLEQGDVLVMADLKGGTPYNESYMCLLENPEHIRLVAGLNLPMLIEASVAAMSNPNLDEVYRTAIEAGQSGVVGTELPDDSSDDDESDLF